RRSRPDFGCAILLGTCATLLPPYCHPARSYWPPAQTRLASPRALSHTGALSLAAHRLSSTFPPWEGDNLGRHVSACPEWPAAPNWESGAGHEGSILSLGVLAAQELVRQ